MKDDESRGDARQGWRFSNPRQKNIYKLLTKIGDGPAQYYYDICRILAMDPQLTTTSTLIFHLLREIESSICSVIEPEPDRIKRESRSEEEIKNRIQDLIKYIEQLVSDNKKDIPPEIDSRISNTLKSCIQLERNGDHKIKIRNVCAGLGVQDSIIKEWIKIDR